MLHLYIWRIKFIFILWLKRGNDMTYYYFFKLLPRRSWEKNWSLILIRKDEEISLYILFCSGLILSSLFIKISYNVLDVPKSLF